MKLFQRYKALDISNDGRISTEALLIMPELAVNPLKRRIVHMIDSDNQGAVSFKKFMMALAPLSEFAPPEEKIEFAFRVYDVNQDGVISSSDLRVIIRILVGSYMSEEYVSNLVEQTMREADADFDGAITLSEFKGSIAKSISHEKILTMIV
jgi:serine/threonine-protein phosphatase 2B regulatory subunit